MMLWMWAAIAGAWELENRAWYLDDHVWLDTESGMLTFDEGWVFRVVDEGRPAGVVVVGTGAQALHFPGGLQAEAAANRLAVTGAPDARVRAVLDGQGSEDAVDAAVILGSGIEVPEGALEVRSRRGAVTWKGPDGTIEVLVTALDGLHAARRRAASLLGKRLEAWGEAGRFPSDLVTLDALEQRPGYRWLAAVELEDAEWSGSRWRSWEHDPSGVLGDGDADAVLAGACCRRLSASAVQEVERVALLGAGVTVAARVKPGGQVLELAAAADLQVQALGAEQQVVLLTIPRVAQEGWHGSPPLPEGWSLEGISDEQDRDLEVVPLQWSPEYTWQRVAVVLREPLAAGEQTRLAVRWRDHHRYAHLVHVDRSTPEETVEMPVLLNVSTDPIEITPRVLNDFGAAPVAYRVAVVSEVDRDHGVMLEGERADDERAGVKWIEGQTTVGQAGLAVGRYAHHVQLEGEGNLPNVAVWLQQRAGSADILGRTARLVEAALPHSASWPSTVHVVDGATGVVTLPNHDSHAPSPHAAGSGGLVTLHQVLYVTKHQMGVAPPQDHHLAAALSATRWGALGNLDREAQEVASFAMLLAAGWAALGGDPEIARLWEYEVRVGARVRGGPLVADAALRRHRQYLAVDEILDAFGEEAVHAALASVLAGTFPPTWAGLADALEAASGIEARGWVGLWLASGVRPALDVRWRHDPSTGELVALLVSDAPAGAFPVTVVATEGDREVRARVTIRDGVGRLRLPWTGAAPTAVQIDAGRLPLREVEVTHAAR